MRKVGYTTGVFDMFHIGHLNVLRRAKLECDYLIVGVTTDELAFERKHRYPIIPFVERIQIVENIRCVDEVVPQTSMSKIDAWRNLKFDRMFVGGDWKGTAQWNRIEQDFSDTGVEIVYFPYTDHTSSTKLRTVVDNLFEGSL